MNDILPKNENKPIISIIVPVYNVREWISECLDSIASQDATNFETILVDDGSSDDSLEILRRYEKENPLFHVYEKENGGLSSSRNFGMKMARGEYIFFLDSDDKLFDEKCVSFMQKEIEKGDIDILSFDGESFFESEELRKKNPYYVTAYHRKESYGFFDSGVMLFRQMVEKQEYYTSACLACYKKEYLERNNLFFEEGYLYEDNLFTFKSMLLAGKVCHNNRIILSRRIRENSITQKQTEWKNVIGYLRAWIKMRDFWETFPIYLADEAIRDVINGVKAGVIRTWQDLSLDKRNDWSALSVFERNELLNILPSHQGIVGTDYVFPYALIEKNKSLVIYGAGSVGKSFFQQAFYSDMVKVVAIVDANAHTMIESNIPVQSPDVLSGLFYDVILISIEREDVAKSVREDLCAMGIPDVKIKWYGDYYRWNRLYGMVINPLMRFMSGVSEKRDRVFWLFLLPEHGNMGDYAIGYAAQTFLNKHFPKIQRIDVSDNEWKRLSTKIIDMVQNQDVVFLNGGGDFGDLWTTGKLQKSIVDMFPNNTVVFLPNTLTYQGGVSNNNKALMEDLKYYSKRKNVHLFFRDRKSYSFCSEYVDNVYCYPDMVLGRVEPRQGEGEKQKAILCFRSDKERVFHGIKKIRTILDEHQWNYEEMDIHQMRYVSQDEGKEVLRKIIERLQSAEVVITDRLHGMVLSVTGQVPCIAFDNSTKKVSGVYEWFKDNPNVILGDESKLDELMKWIEDITSQKCSFKPLEDDFDEMAEVIKRIIG